ncbi:4a-hydroxytetrahydrobiopterin dehydratase [Lentiprolixibacter aurantiacus]|uniref:Putative pterin-4-alpha-carbinolamine dehydratase n=1 Tax=Lentiprolixibacter aurantiacus TaxID=2993939 RepID=A0AAE3SPY6_9FLAO|nr:4a-hydroxytetrahydrobiopterin dehydratase [Lentiprolixibacter aurantiacus]MCX2719942.1 4a-hydroxytetrahydrobiopterin dehydratase [Lentiprolixibacter aurantiacus]
MEKLTSAQIEERIKEIPGWNYTGKAIETNLKFKDFREAFAVMTRIAFECEALNHHPDWKNVYNQLHIALNTHDAQGITEKDFQLAHAVQDIISN